MISTIDGTAGVGKTTLALHWAQTHLDRFPDGQLFVDLRGFSPVGQPTRPLAAIQGFLEALAVPSDRVTGDLDNDAALYRSLVVGRRMLILLDNAATSAQVEPLLPGSSACTVVITSRKPLPTLINRYGARHLRLTVLSEEEADALLTRRLGPARVAGEPTAVRELIQLCGRHPLALAIIAGRAQTRPQIPLAELTAELQDSRLDALDEDEPGSSLPAVLSWSLRGLTDRQRTVFGLLGIAPGPGTGLPAAINLTGLPEQQARKVLRDLEQASLLDRYPGGRYTMHDLVRDFATDIGQHDLTDEARKLALRRVIDFYVRTAHAADRLLSPHRQPIPLDPPDPGAYFQPLQDAPAALAFFETEHHTLLAAQRAAAGHAWHDLAWQLAWTLNTFHYRRGRRQDRLATWQTALNAATHMPDPTPRIIALRLLGGAYANLMQHEEAISHLNQSLALAEEHLDSGQQARVHRGLAWAWEERGNDQRALQHAIRAREAFRALGQSVWEANALNAMGRHAARLGNHDSARSHCRAALTLLRLHHDLDGEADTLRSLGYIAHHTGHPQQAVRDYQQALALFRALGHTTEVANTLDALGHPHVTLGERGLARTAWEEAVQLYQERGHNFDAARVQGQLDGLAEPPEHSSPGYQVG